MKNRILLAIALLVLPLASVAQTPSGVTPSSLTFLAVLNGTNPSSQTLNVNVAPQAASPNWTAMVTTNSGGSWLNTSATSGSGSGSIAVSVSTAGLPAGSYYGNVTVQVGVEPSIPIGITLNVAPTQVNLVGSVGGNPPSQALQVSVAMAGSGLGVNWSASVSTSSGGSWLSVSPTATNSPGNSSQTLTVSANVGTLGIGTYNGLITLAGATFGGTTDNVTPVVLTVSAPQVTLAPTSLTFGGTFGSASPPSQTVAVTTALGWNGSVSTVTGGNWLAITPTSGTGSGTFSASVSLGSLGPGTYQGSITIAAGTGPAVVLNVTLNVAGPNISVAPTTLNFTQVEGTVAAAQSVQLAATPVASSWLATSSVVSTTVSWLSASPSAGVFPASMLIFPNALAANLTAGSYQGTVNIADANGTPTALTVNVSLTVNSAAAAKLTVSPTLLTPQTLQGINPAPANISIGNSGSGSLSWSATATALNGGNWLSVTPSGTAALHASAAGQITFNAASLKPGIYTGLISVSAGSTTPQVVTVLLTVSPGGPLLLLGQSGLAFTTFASTAGASETASVTVANPGSAAMNVYTTVVSGSWISVASPLPFTVPSGGTASLGLTINTAGLKAGVYYGLVQVSQGGTTITLPPQYITVVLNVTAQPAVSIYPIGVILTPSQLQQSLAIFASSGASVTATLTATTLSGGNWLTASPPTLSPNPSATVNVSAVSASLPSTPGVYQGVVTATFNNGTPSQDIGVYLVIPSSSGAQAQSLRGSPAATCTPAQLVMAMRALGSNFSSTVGWPVNLEAQLVDNRANPVTGATVLAMFSTGDTPLALGNLGGGIYSATWNPRSANPAKVTIQALQAPLTPAIVTVNGGVAANATPPPAVSSGGVVNGASFAPNADVTPGSIVSAFGSNLGPLNGSPNSGFPLPLTLGGIKLSMGGIDMPLFYSGTGQVNAQVPAELSPNGITSVVARAISGSTESDAVPVNVTLGPAHPGIFITAETNAPNQGAILNPANQLVDAANPSAVGGVIVIYCTGLGATTPAVATGQAAPGTTAGSSPALVTLPVTVTVGGVNAVVSFAGLSPGFVGLYQVNATIPAGVTTGPAVPVVLTQNGVASNAASIALH